MFQKQKIISCNRSTQKKTKTARMAEMTQVKKGHLSTKFEEKVETRESEMEV